MEGNPRRGTQAISVKQDHCFAYDDDSLRFFANRVSTNEISGEHRQLNHSEVPRVSISEVPIVSVSTGVSRTGEPLSAATSWLDVYSFPHQPSDISEGISKVDIHSERSCFSWKISWRASCKQDLVQRGGDAGGF